MIKYYAYYNFGGYKDFYLGSQEEGIPSKYFLPLLAVYESSLQENPDNEELRIRLGHQRALPQLIALSDKTIEYNYPTAARILMSHAGYKVLYKAVGPSQFALAIRDIAGLKDVYGRQTPFNVMFTGETAQDLANMDIIAEYVHNNLALFEDFLGSIFVNDITENGLRCDVGNLRKKIEEIIMTGNSIKMSEGYPYQVRMLIISGRGMLNNAINTQQLSSREIALCYEMDGTLIGSMYGTERDTMPNAWTNTQHGAHPQSASSSTSRRPIPSQYETLKHPKQADIDQIWNYIQVLEKRITEMEKRLNYE